MTSVLPGRLPRITRAFVVRAHSTDSAPLLRPVAAEDAAGGRTADGAVVGVGTTGNQERRNVPGVGTYLIDTPRDSALQLRQRFLSFQEKHRGVVKVPDEALPDIPYRLHPKPEGSQTPTMSRPQSILKVDVATSPIMLQEDASNSPSRAVSPGPSTSRSVTFMTDHKATPFRVQRSDDVKAKGVHRKKSSSKGASSEMLGRSAQGISEQPSRKQNRRVRECSKLSLCNFNSDDIGKEPHRNSLKEHFSSSSSQTLSRRKSSSLSDLTDVGSLLSWHDRESEMKTSRSIEFPSDNVGPTSFSQKKSKSLLDLMQANRAEDGKPSDLGAYHKRQRIAHLAFRRDNTFRRSNTLSSEEADKEWMDMVNTKVVDHTEYDKFASRRKPVVPPVKKSVKPYSPHSGLDFKISHPASGRVYPVFFNDGLPVRKFGRAAYKRKPPKHKP